MSGPARCATRHLVDRHFAGSIGRRDEGRMRAHLPGCDACRARYRRHLLLAKLDPRALSAEERIARGLGLGGLRAVAGRMIARLSPGSAVVGAAAIAACAVLLLFFRPADPDYRPRGGGDVQARVWAYRVVEGEKPVEVGDTVAADDELAFAYLEPRDGERLLIFGVDEHRHVYWYHPAWVDPSTTPVAVPIAAGRHELPEAISHSIDGAELTVYAFFTREPISVREVEAAIARGDGTFTRGAAWSRRLAVVR